VVPVPGREIALSSVVADEALEQALAGCIAALGTSRAERDRLRTTRR